MLIKKTERVIREFFEKVIKVEVKSIKEFIEKTSIISKDTTPPRLLGINYKEYRVNEGDSKYYHVLLESGKNKIFDFSSADMQKNSILLTYIKNKDLENIPKLTKEEITKCLQPIFDYLGLIENCPNLTPPRIREYNFDYCYDRDLLLEGVPCIFRGFRATISRVTGEVENFSCICTPPQTVNKKPKGEIPIEKVKKVAMDWINSKEFFARRQGRIDESESIRLVIAPSYDFYSDVQWKEKNFYYSYEVPFTWIGNTKTANSKDPGYGVIWIEPDTFRIIGTFIRHVDMSKGD